MQENILKFFLEIATPVLDTIAEAITMLGEQYLFIAVLAFVYWNVSKRKGFILASALVFSQIVNNLIKIIVRAPRPFEKLDYISGKRVETATGYSFPSGHTQGAASFYSAGALIINKTGAYIAAAIVIILVAVSRLYLGVHWPVDVAAGLVFGVLLAFIIMRLVDKLYDNFKKLQLVFQIINYVIMASLAILFYINLNFFDESLKLADYFKVSGMFMGFSGGFFLEKLNLDFDASKGSRLKKGLRFVIGLAGAAGFLFGLKAVFPDHLILDMVRYSLPGTWVSFLWPFLGAKIGLFSK